MSLKHILAPIKIRELEIRNRILRTAHGTYYPRSGMVESDLVAYHAARAKAGTGLSLLESTVVHPSSGGHVVHAWADNVIPGFRALAEAVHAHGMKQFVQLNHGGHQWEPFNGDPRISASDVPSPWGSVSLAMTLEQIEMLVNAYAAAAVRVRAGGLDGVEVHFGHGYLVHQFLSPATNRRTDNYGGSPEKRMRFGIEILGAIRKTVGDDFPIGIRISDQRVIGDGLTIDGARAVVSKLCELKLVDFVNGSTGTHLNVPSMTPAMDTPVGAMLPSSGPIVAAANVPRFVVGRFRTLEEADQVIRDGVADMVGLVRAMIADQDLVRKTVEGHPEQVRPCIACNQGCLGGHSLPTPRMLCTVNPVVGSERELDENLIRTVQVPRKFVVVGGGPAGMEAARTAALHGHKVVLFEALPHLGGATRTASRAPKLASVADILVWLEQEVYRLGVDVRLSSFVDRDEVLAEKPDAVIVATGSVPRMDGRTAALPGYETPGYNLPHVYSSHDIFDVAKDKLGKTAVVYDDVGHYESIAVAEHLIEQGLNVNFVTRWSSFAPIVGTFFRTLPALDRMRKGKGTFNLTVSAQILEIRAGSVTIGYVNSTATDELAADIVVPITINHASRELFDELKSGSVFDCALVGDALEPRDLRYAITEGHRKTRVLAAKEGLSDVLIGAGKATAQRRDASNEARA
jgi:2,4-dienoyl-CoA reductase-like NADH-dependent reductase (Old Yellow Enzyme family)